MGRVVLYRLRADLRRRRALIALAVLVAVLGGVVLATAAGARRTSSAYERLLEQTTPPELLVSPPGNPDATPEPFYAAVADLPGVRKLGLIAGVPLAPQAGTPSERFADALGGIGVLAAIDGTWGTDVGRHRLVSGRLPDPREAGEILVTERFSSETGLHVGDHMDVVLLTESATDEVGLVATADQGQPMRLTVTGVGVAYDEVVPFSDLNATGSILATAPLAELVPRVDWNFEGAFVDVDPAVDLDAMTEEIERLGNDPSLGTGGPVFVADQAAATRRVNDSMQPLAASLAVAATAFGVVVLLIVGQAVARATREPAEEVDTLRALGLRPIDRLGVPLGLAALVGSFGALGAVAVALALSSRFPIGVARVAEPDPGFAVDHHGAARRRTVDRRGHGGQRRHQWPDPDPPARGSRAPLTGGRHRSEVGSGPGGCPGGALRGQQRGESPGADAKHPRRGDPRRDGGHGDDHVRRQPRCPAGHTVAVWAGVGPDARRPVRAGSGGPRDRPDRSVRRRRRDRRRDVWRRVGGGPAGRRLRPPGRRG